MNRSAKIHRYTLALAAAAVLAFAGCGGMEEPGATTSQTVADPAAANLGMDECGACHSAQTAAWFATGHANTGPGEALTSEGSPTLGETLAGSGCAACHDPLGDSANLVAGFTGAPRPVVGCESCHGGGSLHVYGGGSGPIGLARLAGGTIGSTQVSAQFNTCSACHELLDTAGTATATAAHATGGSAAPTGTQYAITDTHFAVPGVFTGTGSVNTVNIGGYAMDYNGATVCTDCHHPHNNTIDIMREWALSAHGDRTANYASDVATQDLKEYFSGAWAHYNWSCDGTNSAGCGTSTTTNLPNARLMCQRCHTTTGFKAYTGALIDGDDQQAADIRDGLVALVTYTSGWKAEMLTCSGCHTSTSGAVRNPGPITGDYSYLTTTNGTVYQVADASYTYPDVGVSNLCMTCHTGRESGETIKNISLTTAPSITTFKNISFINSHYLTAGGTIFTATGYEFSGRSYENPTSYLHNQIGSGNFRDTGASGPCKGCHMSRPNNNGNHLFLPVSRHDPVITNAGTVSVTQNNAVVTGTGTGWSITTINAATDLFKGPDGRLYGISNVDSATQITLTSLYRGSTGAGKAYGILREGERIAGIASQVCFNCHAGNSAILVDMLNEDRELYEASLHALEHALDERGFGFKPVVPYFYTIRYNDAFVSVTTGSTVVTGISTVFSSASISTTTDKFRTYDGELYDIQSVDDVNQTITLKSPYLRSGGTATVSYAIVTNTSQRNWDPGSLGEELARNTLGAAFNFNLLEHDPGAYVHNRTYVRRLLYDAFDWIDDYQLNYSVGATLNARGAEPYKAGAMQYLLPNGIITGVAAERP